MFKRSFHSLLATWLSGLIALLPLALSLALLGWLVSLLNQLIGPTSFIGKLFSSSDTSTAPVKYQIAVRSEGNATTVSVLDANGAPETSTTAQRIVKVLVDDLK